jgi:hypothetical protein
MSFNFFARAKGAGRSELLPNEQCDLPVALLQHRSKMSNLKLQHATNLFRRLGVEL